MADFYTYRNEYANRRRKRRVVLALIVLLALLCAGAGWYWMQHRPAETDPAQADAVAAEPTATPAVTQAPTPEPLQTGAEPRRIVQAVDTAVWDTSAAVEQTIDTEYLNTDHRMIGVPMLGTVTNSYFDTVTFVGDSIASGLGIYQTGYPNAKYATYISAGVNSFVNNASMDNAVTKVSETHGDHCGQPAGLCVYSGGHQQPGHPGQ